MSTADEQALPSWESLYDGSAGGLLLTSPDGTIRLVNDTFCRWIGHAKTDLVGRRRLQDLLTMGGKIFHQTHWAPLLQMQGSIAEVKLEVVHRDGRSIPMVMNAVRRAHPSGLFHEIAALVAEDRHTYERELLAARRRAEELIVRQLQAQDALSLAQAKLRLALGAAKLFVWDVDLATRQRRYEDDVALLIGCSNARSLPDAEYAPCIHPLDREREARTFADAMDAPASGYDCIYRVIGVEGAERVVSSTGRGLFDAQGTLLRFVGVLQDVSETSRQRAAMEDRALFAEQMIGIVSHDLRNPLSAIKMGAALLGRGELSTNQTKTLARLNNSAARAQRLIADLLDFTAARIGSGLQLSPTRFELHELVAESVEELALSFPGHVVQHRSVGAGLCQADADRLVQLIGNLVANAVAYGAQGQPVIVTSTIEAASFELRVHNEGTPIPSESLPGLFQPMQRGGQANAAGRSVGLGLFIVREIVRAHGGDVQAASSAQEGTTFVATFPQTLGDTASAP